jgi:hypothetical protein
VLQELLKLVRYERVQLMRYLSADVASLEWRRLKTNLSRTRPTVYRPWTGMNGGHYPDVNLRFERSI